MSASLLASRLICMFLLLIGTFVFGTAPIYVNKTLFRCDCRSGGPCQKSCRARKGKLVTAFLIYFGGGVLLGTTFLHLLPEAREGFEEHTNCTEQYLSGESEDDHEHGETFPKPEFIVCMGFFAVYLFEEIIHHFFGGHTHVPVAENKLVRTFSRSNSCTLPANIENIIARSEKEESQSQTQSQITLVCDDTAIEQAKPLSLGALLTVAALSFHSLFEGFAVGLRPDAISTWVVFAAIAVHKFVISFVVGLQVIATGGKNLHVYSYMSVFSVMSPAGIAIAMITQSNVEDNNPLTVSVMNAIATGTLLYVTFFEILQREEESKDIGTWLQLVATGTGFAVMCLIQFGSTFA